MTKCNGYPALKATAIMLLVGGFVVFAICYPEMSVKIFCGAVAVTFVVVLWYALYQAFS